MSKKVIGGILFVAGALLMFTGVGAPLGAIAIGAASVSVASIVGVGLMLASSVLLGPATPKMPSSLADQRAD